MFQIKQMHPIQSKTLLKSQPRYYNYTSIKILSDCINDLVYFVGSDDEYSAFRKEVLITFDNISDIPTIKHLQHIDIGEMSILANRNNKIVYVIHTDRLSELLKSR